HDCQEKSRQAGGEYSPAIIAQYLFDLAKEYNRFYAELPIFNESDDQLQAHRIALSAQVAKTVKARMKLLGIKGQDMMQTSTSLNMKIFLLLFACVALACNTNSQSQVIGEEVVELDDMLMEKSFYDFKMKDIDGNVVDFNQYKGKKVLIVNVASKCGYTPQYAELQELNEKYGDQVAILGFPANNFGGQEPGTNADIKQFCTENYGVTFQMFDKVSVKGVDKHPLYRWLSDKNL